jgi:hypothetical protein
MKYLKNINLFTVALPLIILIIGECIERGTGIIFALFSLILVGIIQIILGIIYLYLFPKDNNIKWYMCLVVIFFGLCFIFSKIDMEASYIFIIPLPIFLCIYLSYIIHSKI